MAAIQTFLEKVKLGGKQSHLNMILFPILAPVHKKQLLTYLRLSYKRLGLLINFGEARIKNGISRVVNGLPE